MARSGPHRDTLRSGDDKPEEVEDRATGARTDRSGAPSGIAPFRLFTEWSSPEDEEAYAAL